MIDPLEDLAQRALTIALLLGCLVVSTWIARELRSPTPTSQLETKETTP